MRAKLFALFNSIRSSYWFIPSLMALSAIALARVMLEVDQYWIAEDLSFLPDRLLAFDLEGARAFLTTVAGSMITVAGTVFSVTMVAMTLASQQFGPRLLGAFMRDRGNQVVLGTFLATFLFSLMSLPALGRFTEQEAVPRLTLGIALLLTCGSLAVLIYFIHHAAVSIQVQTLIADVQKDLDLGIQETLDLAKKCGGSDSSTPFQAGEKDFAIEIQDSGYLQSIDWSHLLGRAEEEEIRLIVAHSPGDFLAQGDAAGWLLGAGKEMDAESAREIEESLRDGFRLGWNRSLDHNIEFAIAQLVELAIRALSPGINDPMTAVQCIDALATSLLPTLQGSWPRYLKDSNGVPRIALAGRGFPRLLRNAFDPIRPHAEGSLVVTLRMVERLETLARSAGQDEDREAIQHLADLLLGAAQRSLPETEDQQTISTAHRRLGRTLKAPLAPLAPLAGTT